MLLRRTALALPLAACQIPAPPPFISEAEALPAIVDATCSTAFDCACPAVPWRDEDACRERVGQRTDDAAWVAEREGLRWDGVCVARWLDRLDRLGCVAEGVDDERIAACAGACKPWVGTIAEGEPCQRYGVTVDLDDCAQGLRCSDAKICEPLCVPAEPLPEGARCMAGIEVLGECDADLFCDATDGRCRVAADVGEPCDARPCAASAFCDLAQQPRTCAPRWAEGEPCRTDEACESGLCLDGACSPIVPLACEL